MHKILIAMSLLVMGADVHARAMPLEPQNRLHFGGNWTPGSNSLDIGFDSRMTQLISIDVGSFMSPTAPVATSEDPEGSEAWVLRHGLYVDPGFRIPHRHEGDLHWDVFVRAGFGPVWVADAESDFSIETNPSLNTGLDFMLSSGSWGMRMTGRAYYFKPYSKYQKIEVSVLRPQVGLQVYHQF